MNRSLAFRVCIAAALECLAQFPLRADPARRVVILKVDGLNADLLFQTMREIDPSTGKSRLPWLTHIFTDNGTVFQNFYTRGISLSAPSWSMLDTGRHGVIRGNVEYDRYTGHVYDYLNFFPFYLEYARHHQEDMPGVEVLDRAGIPLVIDTFPHASVFQSFQLFQRGVRLTTLGDILEHRLPKRALISIFEPMQGESYNTLLDQQTESELKEALTRPEILYADFYTGDVDHEGHATNQTAALTEALRRLDALAGRIWTAIQASPLAAQTLFVMVSDHGMNNVPGISSQTFSLPDMFNSPAGGGHHVVTNRPQLSEFKIWGLDPLLSRVITPSTASFYLQGQASQYPTAWLDLDGNERASISLRSSDLNKLHILLLESMRADLSREKRRAVTECELGIIERHRAAWQRTESELREEMSALESSIEKRSTAVASLPTSRTREQVRAGEDRADRRLRDELQSWIREKQAYSDYAAHLHALLSFVPDREKPFRGKISTLISERSLGDRNSVYDLQNYVAGPASGGFVVDADGGLDESRSFRRMNYFALLLAQRVRNNPQSTLSSQPIDFIAVPLATSEHDWYWLYGGDDKQLIIAVDADGRISVLPVSNLVETESGKLDWSASAWRPGLPLHLFEDPKLAAPPGADRTEWLSAAHTEEEWFRAIHLTEYSNGVIGIIEDLSPVARNVPGWTGLDPVPVRYERRRRELVQPDMWVFAANHWNFNVRNFNPGGNHGAFFRISTHSVWMMSGAGVPSHRTIDDPYDSLSFASTVLSLAGRKAPMPERVVAIEGFH